MHFAHAVTYWQWAYWCGIAYYNAGDVGQGGGAPLPPGRFVVGSATTPPRGGGPGGGGANPTEDRHCTCIWLQLNCYTYLY